jgi:hypothetical protein
MTADRSKQSNPGWIFITFPQRQGVTMMRSWNFQKWAVIRLSA